MIIKTLYVDDDPSELRKYKMKFEDDDRAKNRFNIIPRNTPKEPRDYGEIEKEHAELMLIDFDLSKPDANGYVSGISGVSLSTELRQKFPGIPIVLFTRRSVFKIQNYSSIRQTLSSIDEIVYKQDLFKLDTMYLDSLYELAVGFKKLRNKRSKAWADLLEIIEAPEIDYGYLQLSNPPITSGKKWSTYTAAIWIRNTLIKYPGILYNPIHSATFLGISEDAFLSEAIQEVFTKAKYSGLFALPEGRWWKSRLQKIANSMMNQKEKNLPVREGFSLACERGKTTIERSKCVFSGESLAECVCYVLNKPVMIKYSLSYKPDSRPAVMDEARVSFEAVRTSNEVNEAFLDPLGQEMLLEIRKLQKRRENRIGD